VTAPVPLPQLPCDRCLHDSTAALHGERIEGVYCQHRKVGLSFAHGQFQMFAPITLEGFRTLVAAADVRFEQLEERAGNEARPN
jgi:hypothetical protein